MSGTPAIETARLRLVPFSQAHLGPRYLAWLADPAVVRYSENRHRRHDAASCRVYMDEMRSGGHWFWAIETRDDPPVHIGNLTAYLDRNNAVADLAIMVGEAGRHGEGLGGEAWCAAVDWLLADGFRRVQAGTMAANAAMLALFRKSGMREEGRQRERFLLDGRPVDMVFAARLAGDGTETD